jgi:hypothetical protein
VKINKFIDVVRAEDPEIEDSSVLALPDENGVFHDISQKPTIQVLFETEEEAERFSNWMENLGETKPWNEHRFPLTVFPEDFQWLKESQEKTHSDMVEVKFTSVSNSNIKYGYFVERVEKDD